MTAPRGEPAFLQHYEIALQERWPAMLNALREPARRVLRESIFAPTNARSEDELSPLPGLPGCFELTSASESSVEARGAADLRRFYAMDAASVLAARSLTVAENDRVLDLCAAPGGKALILAEALQADGELVLNDRSKSRLGRLKRVIEDYVPPEVRGRITLSCRDGARVGRAWAERFDAILLDAPCSSERHVLTDPSELRKWSPGRIKRLGMDQFALLSSAYLALRPGGKLVYSTCALLPKENDDVVERLLERRPHSVVVESASAPIGEATRYGWQIWPDRDRFGPIYFSRLRKL